MYGILFQVDVQFQNIKYYLGLGLEQHTKY